MELGRRVGLDVSVRRHSGRAEGVETDSFMAATAPFCLVGTPHAVNSSTLSTPLSAAQACAPGSSSASGSVAAPLSRDGSLSTPMPSSQLCVGRHPGRGLREGRFAAHARSALHSSARPSTRPRASLPPTSQRCGGRRPLSLPRSDEVTKLNRGPRPPTVRCSAPPSGAQDYAKLSRPGSEAAKRLSTHS